MAWPRMAASGEHFGDQPHGADGVDEDGNGEALGHVKWSAAHQQSRDHHQVAGDVGGADVMCCITRFVRGEGLAWSTAGSTLARAPRETRQCYCSHGHNRKAPETAPIMVDSFRHVSRSPWMQSRRPVVLAADHGAHRKPA